MESERDRDDTIAEATLRDDDTVADPRPAPARGQPLRPGIRLGRYVLDEELGVGGMGVVHAAFDPDLERRVALKVLHVTASGDEARQRLLREARALARLSHPNVVAVYEVGTADGRDFIAMELVAGETLSVWLRAARRTRHEIVASFVAAGRGLAAAHAAGLVHRDFKPHNILRRPNGSIVVTDFGLARGEEMVAESPPPAVRVDGVMDPTVDVPYRRSSMSGITISGAVLGTPAYMAPEQWSGDDVGPAADQFSFCVALWEALAGVRPFDVEDLDALRASMQRGPANASVMPRRLRSIVRRGLAAEPADRWPSMDALLAKLVAAERRPRLIAIGAAGAAVAAIGWFALPAASPAATCEAPALAPTSVWSPAIRQKFERAGQAPAAAAIERDMARWQAVRSRACAAERGVRSARLACLDGVLARIDVYARAVGELPGAASVEDHGMLLGPETCERDRPPRLVATSTPQRVAATVAALRVGLEETPLDEKAAGELLARVAKDPCAAATAHMLAAQARVSSTVRDADRATAARLAAECGDDAVRAEIALDTLAAGLAEVPADPRTVERADVEKLVDAARAPELDASLRQLQAVFAIRDDDVSSAIKLANAAATLHAKRGRVEAAIDASLDALAYRELRGRPDDLEAGPRQLTEWRAQAVRGLGENAPIVRRIDLEAAHWRFWSVGDAGAYARLEKLTVPRPNRPGVRVVGRVIDVAGAPVAGAEVAAGPGAWGTSWSTVIATPERRIAITRADGTFEIPDAATGSMIVARRGALRSAAVAIDHSSTLQLAPTSRVEGHVELHGAPPQLLYVWVHERARYTSSEYKLVAPVAPDGTFALEGVPRGQVTAQVVRREWDRHRGAMTSTQLVVDAAIVRGVQLDAPAAGRIVHVLLRSTVAVPILAAQAGILRGRIASSPMNAFIETFKQTGSASFSLARPLTLEDVPPAVARVAKAGDLMATLVALPDAESSACALALPPGLSDLAYWNLIISNRDRLFVTCVPVPATAEAIVVDVPPPPRLD